MISPAYQVGQYTLVLDRMAGGTWFYWGPNNLSQYSSIFILISLTRIFFRNINLLNIIGLIVSLYILYETNSRTSIFALGFCLLLVFFMVRKSYARGLFIILTCFSILIAGLYTEQLIEYLYRGQTIDQFLSGTGRTTLYFAAYEIFIADIKNFFIGNGLCWLKNSYSPQLVKIPIFQS